MAFYSYNCITYMELIKMCEATIHLWILGFQENRTKFTLKTLLRYSCIKPLFQGLEVMKNCYLLDHVFLFTSLSSKCLIEF